MPVRIAAVVILALLAAVGVGWMAATHGVRWLNEINDTGVDRWYQRSTYAG